MMRMTWVVRSVHCLESLQHGWMESCCTSNPALLVFIDHTFLQSCHVPRSFSLAGERG